MSPVEHRNKTSNVTSLSLEDIQHLAFRSRGQINDICMPFLLNLEVVARVGRGWQDVPLPGPTKGLKSFSLGVKKDRDSAHFTC